MPQSWLASYVLFAAFWMSVGAHADRRIFGLWVDSTCGACET